MVRWLVEVLFIQTIGSRSSLDNNYRYTACGVIIAVELLWSVLKFIIKPLANHRYLSRVETLLSFCLIALLIVLLEAKVCLCQRSRLDVRVFC